MHHQLKSSQQNIFSTEQFPFYIFDTYGIHENSRNLHWHKALEICHIKEGTGKYLINGIEYSFEKDDVFIINNDEIHVAFDDINLIMQVVIFDPSMLWSGGTSMMDYEFMKPFTEIGMGFNNKLDHCHIYIHMVIETLEQIEEEFRSKSMGYELMIKSLLLKLMAQMIRYFRSISEVDENKYDNSKVIQKLKNTFDFIEQYYYNPITIRELATKSQMSVSHFCYMFKAFSGLPPMGYIIRRRIIASKEALKVTDKKILEVAEECGFNSLSNFNRCFKQLTGITPRQYKKL